MGSSVLRARFGGWTRWPVVVIEEGERMVALEGDGSKEAGPIELEGRKSAAGDQGRGLGGVCAPPVSPCCP